MLFTLLVITLALPLAISLAVANAVHRPAAGMFARLLGDTDGTAWARVLQIVLVLSGTVGGAPLYGLDQITMLAGSRATSRMRDGLITTLYECTVGSLDALASTLMSVLVVAIIAYAIRRRRAPDDVQAPNPAPPTGALAADGA